MSIIPPAALYCVKCTHSLQCSRSCLVLPNISCRQENIFNRNEENRDFFPALCLRKAQSSGKTRSDVAFITHDGGFVLGTEVAFSAQSIHLNILTYTSISTWQYICHIMEKLVLGNTNDCTMAPSLNDLDLRYPGKGCNWQADISLRKCSVPFLAPPSLHVENL